MIEGGGSTTFLKARKWIFAYPEESKTLISMITDVVCDFLLAQICSGAQLIQVFESHAGVLGPDEFQVFILPYLQRVADFLKEKGRENPLLDVPLTIFAKDAGFALEMIVETQYDVIGLDWTIDISKARIITEKYGKTIQGNLDPAALYGTPESITRRTDKMVNAAGKSRYIANLGHGINPDTAAQNLQAFIDSVHSV
jgi:uroporphyrinogen decarboxylase